MWLMLIHIHWPGLDTWTHPTIGRLDNVNVCGLTSGCQASITSSYHSCLFLLSCFCIFSSYLQGCQLSMLRSSCSQPVREALYSSCPFLGLGLSLVYYPPVPHTYAFCPLSWQQGCSVRYAKLVLKPMTFSGSLGMLGKSAKCWWFWNLYILVETHFKSSLHARDLVYLNLSYQWFHVWSTCSTWQCRCGVKEDHWD